MGGEVGGGATLALAIEGVQRLLPSLSVCEERVVKARHPGLTESLPGSPQPFFTQLP